MSALTLYADHQPDQVLEHTTSPERIADILGGAGIRFEQWTADKTIPVDADQEQILDAYRASVDKLVAERGFQAVDVIHMQADHAQKVAFRSKFLDEHTHSEDEVRFFVEGKGLFCLHIDGKVFQVLCTKGDLISVPAGTRHWFDMGQQPVFTAIRFFNNPEGWVANFTGETIARRFPMMAYEADAILVDIEGTIGSIRFVKDTLFPYAAKHLAAYVADHADEPQVQDILNATRELADEPGADQDRIIAILLGWIDDDRKATPLKALQGLIWENGYRQGDFKAHLYEDAVNTMGRWKANKSLYVYSSGSIQAQELYFEFSDHGDVRDLFGGFFDTNMGGKKESQSYRDIAATVGHAPSRMLFLSDVVAELDAAREAGLSTALLNRDAADIETDGHDLFTSLDQIVIQESE